MARGASWDDIHCMAEMSVECGCGHAIALFITSEGWPVLHEAARVLCEHARCFDASVLERLPGLVPTA